MLAWDGGRQLLATLFIAKERSRVGQPPLGEAGESLMGLCSPERDLPSSWSDRHPNTDQDKKVLDNFARPFQENWRQLLENLLICLR